MTDQSPVAGVSPVATLHGNDLLVRGARHPLAISRATTVEDAREPPGCDALLGMGEALQDALSNRSCCSTAQRNSSAARALQECASLDKSSNLPTPT